MTYVDWFNHRRLHGTILTDAGYTTPAGSQASQGASTADQSDLRQLIFGDAFCTRSGPSCVVYLCDGPEDQR